MPGRFKPPDEGKQATPARALAAHPDTLGAMVRGSVLIGFGTDATHGYERTHRDRLFALNRLLVAYMSSPPVFEHDGKSDPPPDNFRGQLAADSISTSDTLWPARKAVLSPDGRDH